MTKLGVWKDFLKKKLNDLTEKGIPKKDGSGEGKRKNKGRGKCPEDEQEEEGKGKNDMIVNDFITTDFQVINDSMLGGYVVRSGGYEYGKDDHENPIVRYKDGKNLQDVYSKLKTVPAYGSKYRDSHYEANDRFLGFWDGFTFIPRGMEGIYHTEEKPDIDVNYDRVWARLNTTKDITELSDLSIEDLKNLPVSASYDDLGDGKNQIVGTVHHIAVSLNKNERDRCSTLGGTACNISPIGDFHDQNIEGEKPTHDFDDNTNGVLSADETHGKELQNNTDISQPPTNKKNQNDTIMTKDKKEKEPEQDTVEQEDDMATTKKGAAPEYEKEEKEPLLEEENELKPKKKKDMATEELMTIIGDLQEENKLLKTFKETYEPLLNEVAKDKGTKDAKDFEELKELLQKEPYQVSKDMIEGKNLAWLREKKDFLDSLPMIQDFIKTENITHEDVNKHVFDYETAEDDPVAMIFNAAQMKTKRTLDFLNSGGSDL